MSALGALASPLPSGVGPRTMAVFISPLPLIYLIFWPLHRVFFNQLIYFFRCWPRLNVGFPVPGPGIEPWP